MTTKKIIAGNWKMNPVSSKEALALYLGIKKNSSRLRQTTAVVFPPAVFLATLRDKGMSVKLDLGAQNMSAEEAGAFTGQISPLMLKNIGAKWVIIGHSEARASGETDADLNAKILGALKNGFKIILCIGEKVRDAQGKYLAVLQNQLAKALENFPAKKISQLVIAYEPVWAIGKEATGVETPDGFLQNSIVIKKTLSSIFNPKSAKAVSILYGGSVGVKNAESFLVTGQADGLLVGRESLDATSFGEILKIADKLR
ncbi:MAG: triose-phosphate isomerase [Candidatus Vogelbacteria bacterium]|nr:triose-phosphate isomerase [Candidatus Vogelbacteria bacterium]